MYLTAQCLRLLLVMLNLIFMHNENMIFDLVELTLTPWNPLIFKGGSDYREFKNG